MKNFKAILEGKAEEKVIDQIASYVAHHKNPGKIWDHHDFDTGSDDEDHVYETLFSSLKSDDWSVKELKKMLKDLQKKFK